jgi:hypothetical protein
MSSCDLVRWARVSKKWHHAAIPYIWNDLSGLSESQYKRLAKIIADDYRRFGCHTSNVMNGEQSSLVKYGPLIRKLGNLWLEGFNDEFRMTSFLGQDEREHVENNLTVLKITRHFLMYCSRLKAMTVALPDVRFQASIAKVIADTTAQQLQHLSIAGRIHAQTLQYTLSRCSTTLETLRISFMISTGITATTMGIDAAGPLSSLMTLKLISCESPFYDNALSPLWMRCESVEDLHLIDCNIPFLRLMPNIMETFFPNLNTITVGRDSNGLKLEDQDLARLLSASRLGWKSIDIEGYLNFDKLSQKALFRHTSTLENFKMVKWYHWKGHILRVILLSFPSLQTFVTLDDGVVDYLEIISFDPNTWIHQSPLTGSLTPWPCEYSLTDLRIKISGIPRPDVTHDRHGGRRQPVVNESYPGEGREIQHRVYERLSRFVNLEVLWLGSNSCYYEVPSRPLKKVVDHQYECLEMSLESGLDQLEGLKRLKMLNVSLMATRVGQREAQWMAEQWPRLREIRGLLSRGDARKARRWLKENSPRIASMKE